MAATAKYRIHPRAKHRKENWHFRLPSPRLSFRATEITPPRRAAVRIRTPQPSHMSGSFLSEIAKAIVPAIVSGHGGERVSRLTTIVAYEPRGRSKRSSSDDRPG